METVNAPADRGPLGVVSDTSVPENEAGFGASLKTRLTELTPLLTMPEGVYERTCKGGFVE
jgi:hypothetical protein